MRPATVALATATIRALEAEAMALVPEGALMQRASAALAVSAGSMLRDITGLVTGSRVVLLVGSGDNGGDALFAGARLSRRGAQVDALLLDDRWHVDGADALSRAGGVLHPVPDVMSAAELIASADLVIDGILGIGGRGALREPAATLAAVARETDVAVLAVDLPSGVDADTGAVADPRAVVRADRTVVLGALKPGLLVGAGAQCSGDLEVVDIGLDLSGLQPDDCLVLVDDRLCAAALARPSVGDDKYTRGVVGLSTGSAQYPGAGVLSTGGARHGVAGYVRHSGPAAAAVAATWPDVVSTPGPLEAAGRVQCWVVGSGRGTDAEARAAVVSALRLRVPVLLDADALTLLAVDDEIRELVREREAVTIITPHDGEFARVAGHDVGPDRVAAARTLATELGAVVLLKGSSTVVAAPSGAAYVAVSAPPELATAGSGDVLAGLAGSLVAHHSARRALEHTDAARLCAVAAHVHGIAGVVAVGSGRTISALDLVLSLPEAVLRIRGQVRSDT